MSEELLKSVYFAPPSDSNGACCSSGVQSPISGSLATDKCQCCPSSGTVCCGGRCYTAAEAQGKIWWVLPPELAAARSDLATTSSVNGSLQSGDTACGTAAYYASQSQCCSGTVQPISSTCCGSNAIAAGLPLVCCQNVIKVGSTCWLVTQILPHFPFLKEAKTYLQIVAAARAILPTTRLE